MTAPPPPASVVLTAPCFPLEKEINVRARESTAQKSLAKVFGQSMLEAGLIQDFLFKPLHTVDIVKTRIQVHAVSSNK